VPLPIQCQMGMRAVILDGSVQDEMAPAREAAGAYLGERGYQVEIIKLREKEIGDCLGCFGCWVKTPGECVVKDDGLAVVRSYVLADVQVLLSPITFGGYSYHLKKVLDRSICRDLPFFQVIGGEMHHPIRYQKDRRTVFIGRLPRRDRDSQAVFLALVERNTHNFRPKGWSSALVFGDENADLTNIAVREALIKAGVKE